MESDQPVPARIGTDHESTPVTVDPDDLDGAARALDQLPAPADVTGAPPPPGAAGHAAADAAIAAFYQRYRAAVSAMAVDLDATASQFRATAAAYRLTETAIANQLAGYAAELPDVPAPLRPPDDPT